MFAITVLQELCLSSAIKAGRSYCVGVAAGTVAQEEWTATYTTIYDLSEQGWAGSRSIGHGRNHRRQAALGIRQARRSVAISGAAMRMAGSEHEQALNACYVSLGALRLHYTR